MKEIRMQPYAISEKEEDIILILQRFSFQMVSASEYVWRNSGRQLNRRYKEKIIQKVILRMGSKLFLPAPLRDVFIVCKSMKYICKGTCTLWKRKIEVSVLDGTAIAVSLLRGILVPRDPSCSCWASGRYWKNGLIKNP